MYIIVEGVNKKDTYTRCSVLSTQLKIDPVILNFPSDHCSSSRAIKHTLEFSTVLSDEQREAMIVKEFKLVNEYAQSLIAKGQSVIINGGPCSYLYCQDKEPDFTNIKKIMNMLPNNTVIEKVFTPPTPVISKSRLAKWVDGEGNVQRWVNRMTEFSTMY